MLVFKGKVRPLKQKDLPASKEILLCWLSAKEVKHYLDFIKNSLNKNTTSLTFDNKYFVAESKDKEVIGILGYRKPILKIAIFATTINPAEINMLYVLPTKRDGQGVGTALINELEKILIAKKYTEILVRSAKRFEKTAWGFYDQLPGFQRISVLQEVDHFEPAQIWQKIIN